MRMLFLILTVYCLLLLSSTQVRADDRCGCALTGVCECRNCTCGQFIVGTQERTVQHLGYTWAWSEKLNRYYPLDAPDLVWSAETKSYWRYKVQPRLQYQPTYVQPSYQPQFMQPAYFGGGGHLGGFSGFSGGGGMRSGGC